MLWRVAAVELEVGLVIRGIQVVHRGHGLLLAQDAREVRALHTSGFRRESVGKQRLVQRQLFRVLLVLFPTFLARPDPSPLVFYLHHNLIGAVLAEDLAAEVTVVSSEEEVELSLATEAVYRLLVRDPQLLLMLHDGVVLRVDHLLARLMALQQTRGRRVEERAVDIHCSARLAVNRIVRLLEWLLRASLYQVWLHTVLVDLVRDLVCNLLRAAIVINDRLVHQDAGLRVVVLTVVQVFPERGSVRGLILVDGGLHVIGRDHQVQLWCRLLLEQDLLALSVEIRHDLPRVISSRARCAPLASIAYLLVNYNKFL